MSTGDRYRLIVRTGPPPEPGTAVELDDMPYRTLRLTASPLPGDDRSCALLEAEPESPAQRPSAQPGVEQRVAEEERDDRSGRERRHVGHRRRAPLRPLAHENDESGIMPSSVPANSATATG